MKSEIERNVYSEENELLSTLYYINFHKVLIKFDPPEIAHIEQNSDHFKRIFLNDAVSKLLEETSEIDVKYNLHKNSNIIESIEISNVESIKQFDFLTFKVMELLRNEKEFGVSAKFERKFYSTMNEILCHIFYLDYNRVFIRFARSKYFKIDNKSEIIQKYFISNVLERLKENNPDLNISYKYYEDTTIIKSISIVNLVKFEDYDYITLRIMDLLSRVDKPSLFKDMD